MNLKKSLLLTLLIACAAVFQTATATESKLSQEVRTSEFSLSKKYLALDGYDPVAYFQFGASKGKKKHTYTHQGVTYRFASAQNLELFKAKPGKYEPQYGGWCAWAMYDGGGRTEPEPENFKIVDGKLYVFYKGFFGDTHKLWNKEAKENGEAALITKAGNNWNTQVR